MMEELCTCKCHMLDVSIMELLMWYDGDILFIIIYYRREQNRYFNVIKSTFHDNAAGDKGGATYL